MEKQRPYCACPYCDGQTIVVGLLGARECQACTLGVVCAGCSEPVKQTTLQVDGRGRWSVLDCEVCQWVTEL